MLLLKPHFENELEKMRFDRFANTETTVDTHGEPIAVDTHDKTSTSNHESYGDESKSTIKVFIMTNTGQKTYRDFHIVQWTNAYPDKLSPRLVLDSTPSIDKEYLYNMVKQKFENDGNIDSVDILLEATSKDSSVIVRTKYVGCEIDQYWLGTNIPDTQAQDLKSNSMEYYEQFFFKCENYSVNPDF
ncbi:MAG: hypothetical protein OEM28_04660 [Nitrosopumilus sp.]|nr:hypothetical protein [Nitrosopumilus sp.]MDH3486682.1 hypothetical protein [Nitrosopumilus sp.]